MDSICIFFCFDFFEELGDFNIDFAVIVWNCLVLDKGFLWDIVFFLLDEFLKLWLLYLET